VKKGVVMVEVSVDDGRRLLVGLKLAVRDAWRVFARLPDPDSRFRPGLRDIGRGGWKGGRHPHLPYRRQNPDLKSSAILADEFHHKAAELAKYGRVLVLLDACHSGGVTGDGSALTSNADLLRSIIAASNVTVLTSRIR
jgi:hypothetical protein